ncbi:MAG TPA: hypothetical protein VF258_05095 [Luteolibacter sp.]
MRTSCSTTSKNRGSSLIESAIAMGVLAVVIPLALGALAESGKSGASAEAETRSTWMVPVCMKEIEASREGRPQFFTSTTDGQIFPPAGEIWALAFSAEGEPVGKVNQAIYDKGTREIDGKPVRYIAFINSEVDPMAGITPMLRVRITLEYPAAAPVAKRQKLDFNTRIP